MKNEVQGQRVIEFDQCSVDGNVIPFVESLHPADASTRNNQLGSQPGLILDVGCGDLPRGNVNVDRFVKRSIHRSSDLNPKKIPNFILADSRYLPFRNACFRKVVSYQTIEHVPTPELMLYEMVRVSTRRVLVVCPHRLKFNIHALGYKGHINKFGNQWFKKMFEMLHCRLIRNDVRSGLLGIPEDIVVKAEKL